MSECPECGHVYSPFDKCCPRCKIIKPNAGRSIAPSPVTLRPSSMHSRRYYLMTSGLVMIALVTGLVIGITVCNRPRASATEDGAKPFHIGTKAPDRLNQTEPLYIPPKSPQTNQLPVSAPSQQAQRESGDLDRSVQNYNNMLQQARDANRNADSAMDLQKKSFDLAMDTEDTSARQQLINESDQHGSRMLSYSRERMQCLQQAETLYESIAAGPNFSKYYQEGELCFTYDQVPVNLQGTHAERLRFLIKR
jgi:hypothetical protein